jgi:uncharacterized C2H2 Zn-finger protein
MAAALNYAAAALGDWLLESGAADAAPHPDEALPPGLRAVSAACFASPEDVECAAAPAQPQSSASPNPSSSAEWADEAGDDDAASGERSAPRHGLLADLCVPLDPSGAEDARRSGAASWLVESPSASAFPTTSFDFRHLSRSFAPSTRLAAHSTLKQHGFDPALEEPVLLAQPVADADAEAEAEAEADAEAAALSSSQLMDDEDDAGNSRRSSSGLARGCCQDAECEGDHAPGAPPHWAATSPLAHDLLPLMAATGEGSSQSAGASSSSSSSSSTPARARAREESDGGSGDEGDLTCPSCQRTFATRFSLNRHLQIHTGEKPFRCGVCGRRFRQRGTLLTHNRLHTGEMPFTCAHCGVSFRHRNRLITHQRKCGTKKG